MSAAFGRLTMIGAGNMGGAILSGLVAGGADPTMITAVEAYPARREQLASELGIHVTADAAQAVATADVVVVAVKPKQVADALTGLPVREGALILDREGNDIGRITSGGHSPSLGRPIAMGYVAAALAEPGTFLKLEQRGKLFQAQVTPMPFVPHKYQRKTAGA